MFKHAFYLFQELVTDSKILVQLFHSTMADDCLLYRMEHLAERALNRPRRSAIVAQKAQAVIALVRAISGKERILYKAVVEKNRGKEGDPFTADAIFGSQKFLDQRKCARKIYRRLQRAGFLASSAQGLGEHNLLIDCHTDMFPLFDEIQIVGGHSIPLVRLADLAPSVTQLGEDFRVQACKIRVFINPIALNAEYQNKPGRTQVREFIEQCIVNPN